MKRIAIFNFKGGTGKTTSAVNIAAALASLKKRVLLIDLDGNRSLSFAVDQDGATPTIHDALTSKKAPQLIEMSERQWIVPGDIRIFNMKTNADMLEKGLTRIENAYDLEYILMDCPPDLGPLTSQAIICADHILMPTKCRPASVRGLSEAIQMIQSDEEAQSIQVLRTQVNQQLNLTKDVDEALIEGQHDFGFTLLHNSIPENVKVSESFGAQRSVIDYAPRSTGAKAYVNATRELVKLWK